MYLGHVWAYLICHKWLFLCVQIMMNVQCMVYAAKPARIAMGRIIVAAQMATDCRLTDTPAKPNRVRIWWINDWNVAWFLKLCKALLLFLWVQTTCCHSMSPYYWCIMIHCRDNGNKHHWYKSTVTHWSINDLIWMFCITKT